MGFATKTLMVTLVAGCALTALISYTNWRHLEVLHVPHANHHGWSFTTDAALADKLQEFPSTAQQLEKRLSTLEKVVAELVSKDGAGGAITSSSPSLATQNQAFLPAPTTTTGATKFRPKRWRDDGKCGRDSKDKLPDGSDAECNGEGPEPCCAPGGWCGNTDDHCFCSDCVDYRSEERKVRDLKSEHNFVPTPSPSRDATAGATGTSTVLVIIPFRDREGHLVKFKQYWRWFGQDGILPRKVKKWEVFVMEQFDPEVFNRGWNFNAGLAIASAMTSASKDITPEMKFNFDCAIIQDIDYLPEEGVDYTYCDYPTQLSAEIDRYNWKTPYMASAGGIVAMNLGHWQQINGFGNDYFGWGGEDDELHHRLRLNGLLYGDCYPFCKKHDKNAGKTGISIRRPKKGHGRFSGKFMHSANHTKRITDSSAYAKNVKMLNEIASGSSRWKNDGLSNLQFRIIGEEVDETDKDVGIVYRHIRVHRGSEKFDVHAVKLAIPDTVCSSSLSAVPQKWSVQDLGPKIPWNLDQLRSRVASSMDEVGADCNPHHLNFVLIDRRHGFAKILSDEDPRLLTVYFRSLKNHQNDGLIVADPRKASDIRESYAQVKSFVTPPTEFGVCKSKLPKYGPKYSVHEGPSCSGGGWDPVEGGGFFAYTRKQPGLKPVSWCNNEKHWTQLIVDKERCPKEWQGLKWVQGGTFWTAVGSQGFCVGTRASDEEMASFSRMLPQDDCSGASFDHNFAFSPAAELPKSPSVVVCVVKNTKSLSVEARLGGDSCEGEHMKVLARFAARRGSAAASGDKRFCVEGSSKGGDIIRPDKKCSKSKFSFAIPSEAATLAGSNQPQHRTICVVSDEINVGAACTSAPKGSIVFDAPSAADVGASLPWGDLGSAATAPLVLLVDEEVPCFGFLCPAAVKLLFHEGQGSGSGSSS